MSNETPAEVLADIFTDKHRAKIAEWDGYGTEALEDLDYVEATVRKEIHDRLVRAMPDSESSTEDVCIVCEWDGDTARFVEAEVNGVSVSLPWRDRQDGLKELVIRRSLAAGKVATYAVFARSDEYPEPLCITGYAGTESEIARKVMEAARREGYRGTFADRMKELGWWIAPLYTAPPADPAKATECANCGNDGSSANAGCHSCGETTAKASGSAPDGWRPTRDQITSACEAYASGGQDFRTSIERALIAAKLATPPASAPEVTEQAIERVALALATSIERDELQAYAYRAHARRAIAALQQEGKSHGP